MKNFVVDASAGADLLLNTSNGQSLDSKLPTGAHWWVPEHYLVEVAGVLRRSELTGLAAPARVAHAFHLLTTGSAHRVQVRPLMGAAWSRRGHLTFGDALYVPLAEQVA